MAYVIAEPCIGVKDTACVDACPVDCIHPGRAEANFDEAAQLYIDPDNCICCAACVSVCPVSAIYLAEDLPLQWKEYVQINAERYASKNAPHSS
jgi:ferredoxin